MIRASSYVMKGSLFGCILLGAAGCASTQAPEGWSGDFDASTVITRALVAHQAGRAESFAAEGAGLIATLRVRRQTEGTAVAEQQQLFLLSPETWALRVSGNGGDRVYVADGLRCAEVRDGEVVRADVPIDETGVDRVLQHLFLLRWLRFEDGKPPRIVSTEKIDGGRHAIHIEKTDGRGNACLATIDSASLRPSGLKTWATIAGRQFELKSHYAAFSRDDLGNEYPSAITSAGAGFEEEIEVVEIRRKRGMDARQFRLPSRAPRDSSATTSVR